MRRLRLIPLLATIAFGCGGDGGDPGCSDLDGDGFGNPGREACPSGSTLDCDDMSRSAYPGAPELCDFVDNDCDGQIDEGLDADGDGFKVCGSNPDCNDSDPSVRPGAAETCDFVDNDCDGTTDEGCDPSPRILIVSFPNEILCDGTLQCGELVFEDWPGDVVRVVGVSSRPDGWTWSPTWNYDPGVYGRQRGTIQVCLSCEWWCRFRGCDVSQGFDSSILLQDAKGNLSSPWVLSYRMRACC